MAHPTSMQPPDWWVNPAEDIDSALLLLGRHAALLKNPPPCPKGATLRRLLAIVEKKFEETQLEIRAQVPCAFFKPSYEQSLLLNAWWCGVDFVVCFAANRIGKTASLGVINPLLWILPNNPDWEMFSPSLKPNPADEGATFIANSPADQQAGLYYDLFQRPVQVLPRPTLAHLSKIREVLLQHPELAPDPALSHLIEPNKTKFASLQKLCPTLRPTAAAWPYAPTTPSPSDPATIWIGAPDNDFHRNIIMREWRKWLPKDSIKRWSDADLTFDISNASTTNPTPAEYRFVCKSYESEDTKWSGSAVLGIILTEGLPQSILNEVKQRIKQHGFGSWDYTPYEARNIGSKTQLAYRVYKGEEQLPLRAHIFTRFSARNAPAHILPTQKKDDLIRMWQGLKEGDARLDGIFYSSSPLVLSQLSRPNHTLPWSIEELFERYPTGQVYRGLDPGYDHPSVCCWGLLTPGNIWFIYRYYAERQTTIEQRCADIVRLSNNELHRDRWGPNEGQYNLVETHTLPNSEPVVLTATDYHAFKIDEVTGQSASLNYIKNGLLITESTHMKPEDRALTLDNLLRPSEYHTHPITRKTPGSRVYWLINGPGVDAALQKMETLFWDRLASGPNKGEAKDKVPSHKDDELDATCYLTCGPYSHSNYRAERRQSVKWSIEQENANDPFLQACNF